MTMNFLRVCCVVAGLQAGAISQGGWIQVTTSGPSARFGHAMAYDSQRSRIVLFGGGTNGPTDFFDTWERHGTTWTQVSSNGPLARSGISMAYDSQRARTILFGGVALQVGGIDYRTWEWDGTAWSQVATGGPSAQSSAMAYDSYRGRLVLFTFVDPLLPGFTHEWNGTNWASVNAPGPAGASGPALCFDSWRGVPVLFGGYGGGAYTWEFGATGWVPFNSPGPGYRTSAAMAFDSQRGKAVVFGGYPGSNVNIGDTWEWNGADWAQVATTGPGAWFGSALAFDAARGRSVLFGGQVNGGVLNETWEWTGSPGSAATFGTACGSPPLSLSAGPAPNISGAGQATIADSPSSLAFVALGWSRTAVGPFALPMPLVAYGMPGCFLLQSAEAAAQPVTFTSPSTATYSLPVPNWAGLIGLHLYLQAWAYAPGANAGHTIVSNGLEWVIGY